MAQRDEARNEQPGFNNASQGALHGTAHNFGSTTGVSEVYNFFVRPATANPNEQPGMECQKS